MALRRTEQLTIARLLIKPFRRPQWPEEERSHFSPGIYLSGSIHLRSNITIELQNGSVLRAAEGAASYDPPEPNPWDKFQDSGHSHWHNSLIWGENLHDISITGTGSSMAKR